MIELMESFHLFWSLQLAMVAILTFWLFNRNKYSVWSKQGVKGPTAIPCIGTEWEVATKSLSELTQERYEKYGKLYGIYMLYTPVLVIHDPELIKQVLIKDFQYFVNRNPIRTYHEIMNQNLFNANDQKWKRMRTIASPSFTTGKLRKMSTKMNECVDRLFKYFDNIIDKKQYDFKTKKVVSGFTMDVIAWAGFGALTNFNNHDKDDDFYENALGFFRLKPLRILAVFSFPKILLRLLKIDQPSEPKSFNYFFNLTSQIINQRKLAKISKSNDLIQLMLDAEVDEKEFVNDNYHKLEASMDDDDCDEPQQLNSTKPKGKLTEKEVIANSIVFLLAGFETTSSTISHFLYHMALDIPMQERVYEELVDKLQGKDVNSVDFYNAVMREVPYFEACVKETLRMYPPVTFLMRELSADSYKLGGIELKKNYIVSIPVHVIHHMPEYYPEPESFKPERFLPENKDKLIPYTYMPFGLGPRNCIGMRFAYQEIHIALARIIMKYRFEPAIDTPKKLTFAKRSFVLSSNEFNLKISKR